MQVTADVWSHVEKRCLTCYTPSARDESLRGKINVMIGLTLWNADYTPAWELMITLSGHRFNMQSTNTLITAHMRKIWQELNVWPEKKSWNRHVNLKQHSNIGKQYQANMCLSIRSKRMAAETHQSAGVTSIKTVGRRKKVGTARRRLSSTGTWSGKSHAKLLYG